MRMQSFDVVLEKGPQNRIRPNGHSTDHPIHYAQGVQDRLYDLAKMFMTEVNCARMSGHTDKRLSEQLRLYGEKWLERVFHSDLVYLICSPPWSLLCQFTSIVDGSGPRLYTLPGHGKKA